MTRELVVKGIGNASAAADLIALNMNLEVREVDYEGTMRRSVMLLDELRAAMVSVGHDGKALITTRFNIDTVYKGYQKNDSYRQRFIGYVCNHSLKLEFDLDMSTLSATLGTIAECEAKPNFDIKFSVKDRNAVSAQLLESAVENAKWKAAVLANAAGVRLGAIQRIDYNWSELQLYSQTNYRSCYPMVVCEESKAYSLDIETEDIDVSDTATVVWAIA